MCYKNSVNVIRNQENQSECSIHNLYDLLLLFVKNSMLQALLLLIFQKVIDVKDSERLNAKIVILNIHRLVFTRREELKIKVYVRYICLFCVQNIAIKAAINVFKSDKKCYLESYTPVDSNLLTSIFLLHLKHFYSLVYIKYMYKSLSHYKQYK